MWNSSYYNMNNAEKRTDFLFPKRSFWTGVSSILSIFGEEKKFNTSKSGKEADFKALNSDWEMIGQDLRKSMSKIILQDCE